MTAIPPAFFWLTVTAAVVATALHPVAASDPGPRLAFASSSYERIEIVDPATRALDTVVYADPFHVVLDPSWDPAGQRLAYGDTFGVMEPIVGELRAVDVSTRRVTTLLTLPTLFIAEVAWSPRGDRIAFSTSTAWTPLWGLAVSHRSVHVVNADGTGHRVIDAGTNPSWSPDGERMAYAGVSDVVVVDPDDLTSARPVLTPFASDAHPMWSPDGRSVAFLSGGTLTAPWVLVTRIDTGEIKHLPVLAGSAPTWSPDSKRLAYADRGIVTVDVQSGTRHRLSFEEDYDSHAPAWGAHGVIAVHRWRSVDTIDPQRGEQLVLVEVSSSPRLAWSN